MTEEVADRTAPSKGPSWGSFCLLLMQLSILAGSRSFGRALDYSCMVFCWKHAPTGQESQHILGSLFWVQAGGESCV